VARMARRLFLLIGRIDARYLDGVDLYPLKASFARLDLQEVVRGSSLVVEGEEGDGIRYDAKGSIVWPRSTNSNEIHVSGDDSSHPFSRREGQYPTWFTLCSVIHNSPLL
jgi:hypothetical protein